LINSVYLNFKFC